MALSIGTAGTSLQRSGVPLNPHAAFTIVGWGVQGSTTPTGAAFRTFYNYGDIPGTAPYIYLGSDDNANNVILAYFNGVTYVSTTLSYTPTEDTYFSWAIRYDGASALDFIINATLIQTLTINLSTITFTSEDDIIGGSWDDFSAAYVGVFQTALTLAQITAQSVSPTPLSVAVSFTKLLDQDDLSDFTGNGHVWTKTGTGFFTVTGPTIPFNDAAFIVSAANATGDIGLFPVTATGVVDNTILAGSDRSLLARRPSDNHVFAFTNSLTVKEYTADLSYVQTFTSLIPYAGSWERFMIQFVGSSVFLGWTGFSGTSPHVSVQKRNATTFALITETLDFNTGLPAGSSQPQAMSPDGNLIYFKDVGSGVLGQNIIYAYNIATATASSFASYGTWSGTTGWLLHAVRTMANSNVVGLFLDQTPLQLSHLVMFSSSGGVLSSFDVLTQTIGASKYQTRWVSLDTTQDGVWTTGTFGPSQAFDDAYLHYRLADGALLGTALPPLDIHTGSPGDILAAGAVVSAPVVVTSLSMACDTGTFTINGNGFTEFMTIAVQGPLGILAYEVESVSPTQVILSIDGLTSGVYCVDLTPGIAPVVVGALLMENGDGVELETGTGRLVLE